MKSAQTTPPSLQPSLPRPASKHRQITLGSIVGRFIGWFVAFNAATWTLMGVTESATKLPVLEGSGPWGIFSFLLVCIVGALLLVICHLWRVLGRESPTPHIASTESQPSDTQLSSTLLDDLQSAFDSEAWEEVIKIGSVIGRPLWVLGKYRLRVEVGRLVEAAAARSGHTAEQAMALIDDLGWTLFAIGNRAGAEKNIVHGISVAKAAGYHKLASKGHRHLSGFSLADRNLQKAELEHQNAVASAKCISDEIEKTEALTGLRVNYGLLAFEKGDFTTSLRELETAQRSYEEAGDPDRAVKLYHFIGAVLFQMGELAAAKDTYRRGLTEAKQHGRRDGILKNTIGLAKVAKREENYGLAKELLEQAEEMAHEIGYEAAPVDSTLP